MPKIRVIPIIPNGLVDYKKPQNTNKEEELLGYKTLNPNAIINYTVISSIL